MMIQLIGLGRHRRETIGLNKAGLVSALLLGGFHLMWALIVASGFAQPLVDFIFWAAFHSAGLCDRSIRSAARRWIGAADGHSWLCDRECLCALMEPCPPPSSLTMHTTSAR